jgi:hypothetical protein
VEDWRRLFLFDKNLNGGLLFGHPWLPFDHPQLGPVEISELPSVFGLQNPPQNLIEEVVSPQAAVFRYLIEIAPRPVVTARLLSEQSVVLTIANQGFLPTFVSKQKDKAHGAQRILVHVARGAQAFDDLDGWVPVNTGWIDFAANGSSVRTSFSIEIPKADFDRGVRVAFPRAGVVVVPSNVEDVR